jgi:ABC-2 type transport system ATP-binding protein
VEAASGAGRRDLHQPRLLLLDEPTAGVDPKARREFWDEIHALAEGGLTVLVSTHYMDEAERCHDIGYILYGRLIARGTAGEIIGQSGLVTFNGTGPASAGSPMSWNTGTVCSAPLPLARRCMSAGPTGRLWNVPFTPWRRDPFAWHEVSPSLEDVFIQLMGRTTDDRYAS